MSPIRVPRAQDQAAARKGAGGYVGLVAVEQHLRNLGFSATYNFREWDDELSEGEYPGQSCFLRVDDRVFHTYSMYARGAEMLGGSYYWLDLTALGRQEEWEKPEGRTESARAAQPDFAS